MKLRPILLALLLVGAFFWLTNRSGWTVERLVKPVRETGRAWTEPAKAHTASLTPEEENNIEVFRSAKDATVNITSTVYRRNFFFEVYPSKEMGSGFIINSDGRILTNAHVLQGRGKIEVTTFNHDRYEARILARDTQSDLALIQITPKGKLPVLRLGDSENLQVGQKVLAIGNPFGLEGTLTTGIISSIGRDISDENNRHLEGMVQTDAAINPGNSGGPLLDSHGSVIGINTAIYGPGGNIGIGFALPISRAKRMLEDFAAGRKFGRPWLGVSVVYVAGDLAEALRLPAEGGLLIQEIAPDSAAAGAGLRGPRQSVVVGNTELLVGGDLIVAIDGKPADRPDAISRSINSKRPGDTVELTVYRSGQRVKIKVQLSELPESNV
jgi:S1-C subfamily serine protease